jgi:hypothetical protein
LDKIGSRNYPERIGLLAEQFLSGDVSAHLERYFGAVSSFRKVILQNINLELSFFFVRTINILNSMTSLMAMKLQKNLTH